MQYTKPYVPLADQLALMKSRGMGVSNDAKATEYLHRIGYYRLSAYCFPFRKSDEDAQGTLQTSDRFRDQTSFKDVTDLYAFDKALRLIALDALERIEISLRTEIALALGTHNPTAHRDIQYLDRKFYAINHPRRRSLFTEWLEKLDEKAKTSKEEFAVHFRTKYFESTMPIWIAVELLDFGGLSHLLSGMKNQDLMKICASYNLPNPTILKGWVKSLSFVRNVCAHHSRFWNKPLVNQPPLPAIGSIPDFDHVAISPYQNYRVYAALCVMRHLLKSVNPRTKWAERLKTAVDTFPETPYLLLKTAGFPDDWDRENLWQ
jgi:abortive infection bacteriophage resistance protein